MIRRPPRSTLFPTRRSSDLRLQSGVPERASGEVTWLSKPAGERYPAGLDRKSTRLNSSHVEISYAVFCLKKKKKKKKNNEPTTLRETQYKQQADTNMLNEQS